MHCQSCQHENPAEARFCMQCGSRLVQVCLACQHVLPPEAKFCMACGAPLAQESKVQSPTSKVENNQPRPEAVVLRRPLRRGRSYHEAPAGGGILRKAPLGPYEVSRTATRPAVALALLARECTATHGSHPTRPYSHSIPPPRSVSLSSGAPATTPDECARHSSLSNIPACTPRCT